MDRYTIHEFVFIIGKTKSTASQNEKYKKCRLISVYVKLKRHSFLV